MKLCTDAEIVGPWVYARAGGRWIADKNRAGIGRVDDAGKLMAGVVYEDFNGVNVVKHMAAEGNWASRRFLGIMFDYPFNKMGVKRITAPIHSANQRCIDFALHLGYTLECKLAQATPGGDVLIFRMFREDCKYLGGRYALFD